MGPVIWGGADASKWRSPCVTLTWTPHVLRQRHAKAAQSSFGSLIRKGQRHLNCGNVHAQCEVTVKEQGPLKGCNFEGEDPMRLGVYSSVAEPLL